MKEMHAGTDRDCSRESPVGRDHRMRFAVHEARDRKAAEDSARDRCKRIDRHDGKIGGEVVI